MIKHIFFQNIIRCIKRENVLLRFLAYVSIFINIFPYKNFSRGKNNKFHVKREKKKIIYTKFKKKKGLQYKESNYLYLRMGCCRVKFTLLLLKFLALFIDVNGSK